MNNKTGIPKFDDCINKICRSIDDSHSREEIRNELGEHLLSSYDSKVKSGMSSDLAIDKTLEEFANDEDLKDIGRDIDKVHTPKASVKQFGVALLVMVASAAVILGYIWITYYKLISK